MSVNISVLHVYTCVLYHVCVWLSAYVVECVLVYRFMCVCMHVCGCIMYVMCVCVSVCECIGMACICGYVYI